MGHYSLQVAKANPILEDTCLQFFAKKISKGERILANFSEMGFFRFSFLKRIFRARPSVLKGFVGSWNSFRFFKRLFSGRKSFHRQQ